MMEIVSTPPHILPRFDTTDATLDLLRAEFRSLSASLCLAVREEVREELIEHRPRQKTSVTYSNVPSFASKSIKTSNFVQHSTSTKTRLPMGARISTTSSSSQQSEGSPQRPKYVVASYKAAQFAQSVRDRPARPAFLNGKDQIFSTTKSEKSIESNRVRPIRLTNHEDDSDNVGETVMVHSKSNSSNALRSLAQRFSVNENRPRTSNTSMTGSACGTTSGAQSNKTDRFASMREAPKFDQKVEKAMGLTPQSLFLANNSSSTIFRGAVLNVVQEKMYSDVVSLLIFFNAVAIGFQTDYLAHNVGGSLPTACRIFEVIFGMCFTIDMSLRMCALGCHFWQGYGWAWNFMDFVLVLAYLAQEFFQRLYLSGVIDETGFVRRSISILRSIQIVRTLHLVRASEDLRLLLSCLMHSLRTFFWAMGLLCVMTYIMTIILTDVTADARGAPDISAGGEKELSDGFGSVPRTMLSLFQSISGGIDWIDLANPLIEFVSTVWGFWFGVYIAIIVFALLNLITGLFVETALKQAEHVHDKKKMAEAWKVFQSIDIDDSGSISRDEMQNQLASQHVQEYFKSIDLEPSELNTLFDIIDADHSESVNFQEFLNGCLRFQGTAKSVDVLLIMQQVRHIQEMLEPWYAPERARKSLLQIHPEDEATPFSGPASFPVIESDTSVPTEPC